MKLKEVLEHNEDKEVKVYVGEQKKSVGNIEYVGDDFLLLKIGESSHYLPFYAIVDICPTHNDFELPKPNA